jgi:RNA polymerase sigma-70 factor (ECF subfamily)
VRWQRSTPAVRGDPAPSGERLAGALVADLVGRAKRGDGEAFGLLYDRYVGEVYAFVAVRLSDRGAAEDATQTIFVRALQSLASCRDDAAFPGWLFAIARNIVTDTYRAARFRPETLDTDDESFDPEDAALSPEEVVLQRDDAHALHQARERCLSAGERELFDLLLTDMNDKQIAQALGRSHGAVRTAHYRLMAKLRECLERMTAFTGVRGVHV